MKQQNSLMLIIMALFMITPTFAQKLKREVLVTYKYVQPPITPLPKDYKAYLLNVNSDDQYIADEIYSNFNLVGYDKKKSGKAEFIIEITDYPFTYTTEKHEKIEKVTKDNKTTTHKYYTYSYDIKYKLSSRMTDLDGEEMFSTVADISKSGETSPTTNATQAYKDCMATIKQYKKDRAVIATNKLNNIYNNKFGYPVKSKRMFIYKIKPKKFNYDDFEEAYNIAKQAAQIIADDMNATEECMKAYAPAIQIWENALKESDITKKKTRVNKNVTCACYYNLGTAYLLCQDYDKAIENFTKLTEIDKRFFNTNNLLAFAKDMKKRVEANK